MALVNAPNAVDTTAIQFKTHSKYQIYDEVVKARQFNNVDLLASASSLGLIIAGQTTRASFQVIQLNDVVERKDVSEIPIRTVTIPGVPYYLAVSCDDTILSVCYAIDSLSFIDLYSVQSFLSADVKCILSKIVVSNAENVKVNQILWNPIIANTMALCLSDGTLSTYAFKENSYEFNALNPSENIRCACWSPKGKQIVASCPGGKLVQFKPDLKLAKTIPCEVQLFSNPFRPLAIQWLSTYQFAVVFVEDREDAQQALFIVNAPKNSKPTYINYYDITYSQPGPRAFQVYLVYILQWNILLMASSNGTEIGIIGTSENSDTPQWTQYILIDEGRAELPLTADKQDSFPIGLALEKGTTHRIIIGEKQLPVMPMLHILSTHGILISFNILNSQPTHIDICSPPQIISDKSGIPQFQMSPFSTRPSLSPATPPQIKSIQSDIQRNALTFQTPASLQPNMTFSLLDTGATSTPAKPTIEFSSTFNAKQPIKADHSEWHGSAQPAPVVKINSAPKDLFRTLKPTPPPAQSTPTKYEKSEPFITIKPNAKPTTHSQSQKQPSSLSCSENDKILQEMIKQEVKAFNEEINAVLQRSRSLQINASDKNGLSILMKNIDEMQAIIAQANESIDSMKSDVQSLHLILYEMLAMLSESQAKLRDFHTPNPNEGNMVATQMHRRLINKLQNLLTEAQSRYDTFSKQFNANWFAHLQKQRENDKARMRIPTMEHVYKTIRTQQQILMREREKIKAIKAKIGAKTTRSQQKIVYSYSSAGNLKMNSLINSVLSMSIRDQMKPDQKALNTLKLAALRENTLNKHQMNYIKPTRPIRNDLGSEFIIGKRNAYEKERLEQERLKQNAEKKPMITREVTQAPFPVDNEPIKKNLQPIIATTIGSNFGKTLLQTPSSPQTTFNKIDPKPSTISSIAANDTMKSKLGFTAVELAKPLAVPIEAEIKMPASMKSETPKSTEKQFGFQFGNTISGNAQTENVARIAKSPLSTLSLNVANDLASSQSAPPLPTFGQNTLFGAKPNNNMAKTPIISPIAIAVAAKPPVCSQLIPPKKDDADNEPKSSPHTVQDQLKPQNPLFGAPMTQKSNSTSLICKTSTPPAISTFSFASAATAVPSNISSDLLVSKQAQLQTPVTSNTSTMAISSSSKAPSAATADTTPASKPATDGGSLFKGFSICKPTSNSIFGATTASAEPSGNPSNIFGGSNTSSNMLGPKPAELEQKQPSTANIFGSRQADPTSISFASFNVSSSPSNTAQTTNVSSPSTGNIFGSLQASQNMFDSNKMSSSSIFGGASNNTASTAPPVGLFGSVASSTSNTSSPPIGNIFGGVSGGGGANGGSSIFGGSSALGVSSAQPTSPAPASGSIFGSPSTGFASVPISTATASFGSSRAFQQPTFIQANLQTSPDTFHSPNQQQNSGNTFGIGANMANQTFGSGAVFGNAKSGFGTFGSVSPNASFGSTQGNPLFESLGASNNTMTFSNLAQNQNAAPPANSFSGGSSFSSWR